MKISLVYGYLLVIAGTMVTSQSLARTRLPSAVTSRILETRPKIPLPDSANKFVDAVLEVACRYPSSANPALFLDLKSGASPDLWGDGVIAEAHKNLHELYSLLEGQQRATRSSDGPEELVLAEINSYRDLQRETQTAVNQMLDDLHAILEDLRQSNRNLSLEPSNPDRESIDNQNQLAEQQRKEDDDALLFLGAVTWFALNEQLLFLESPVPEPDLPYSPDDANVPETDLTGFEKKWLADSLDDANVPETDLMTRIEWSAADDQRIAEAYAADSFNDPLSPFDSGDTGTDFDLFDFDFLLF